MPKLIRIIVLSCTFLLFSSARLSANYTFNNSFDIDNFSDWITIPNHVTPEIVSLLNRTYARFHSGSTNSYGYLGKKSDTDHIVSVSFDFYYPDSYGTQGSGFMLTDSVPTSSQNPPNDNGHYSVGLWPLSGYFHIVSPLCDNTSLCNLPVYYRAVFKLNPDTWNYVSITYLTDGVSIKLNES